MQAEKQGLSTPTQVYTLRLSWEGVDVTNAVSGPARISSLLGESAKSGFSAGFKTGLIVALQFMALISVSLFIMNLLPIPVLDGGLILIAFIEILIRRKINPRIQYYVQFIGLAFIIFIFIIGLKGDISYFFSRGK